MSKQVINICAPCFDPYDSYGRVACELAWNLSEMGVHVNAISNSIVYDTQSEALQDVLSQPIKPMGGGICMGYPDYGKFGAMVNAGPIVAVTMFESTQLPETWAENLNRCAAVIVPTDWNVDVFKTNGIKPELLAAVPLGVSDTFQNARRVRTVARNGARFRFLVFGDRGRRKGWDVALKAFTRLYGKESETHELVIKTRGRGVGVGFDLSAFPAVTVIKQDMTEPELLELFKSVDAFVFPTRGEGFGLPPREAAATGLPVIVTNWSGTADRIRQWAYPLNYSLVDAWEDTPELMGLGQWAEPDEEHLMRLMEYVASGNPFVRRMANESARRIDRYYRWPRFAESVLKIYNKAIGG